jgi:hypothetical protein
MLVSTQRCHQFNHPEFVVEVDESRVPEEQIKRFMKDLEGMVAEGSVFEPRQTFKIGWMITEVQRFEGSRLTLLEPDMESLPIQLVPGITETLHQQIMQVFFIDSLAIPRQDMEIPDVRQSAMVCSRYRETNGLFLARSEPYKKTDSGWFLGCLDDDHDHEEVENLEVVSLYEAFLNRNEIHLWAAFPRGSLIALEEGLEPRISRDDTPLDIVPGSFLDQMIARWR